MFHIIKYHRRGKYFHTGQKPNECTLRYSFFGAQKNTILEYHCWRLQVCWNACLHTGLHTARFVPICFRRDCSNVSVLRQWKLVATARRVVKVWWANCPRVHCTRAVLCKPFTDASSLKRRRFARYHTRTLHHDRLHGRLSLFSDFSFVS